VVAAAAEVAAAAGAAAAGSVAAWVAWVARAAAYPAERAACAKSHDLTAGLAKDSAKLGLQSISLLLVATLRKSHPTDSIAADFPKVAFGSKTEVTGRNLDVRCYPGNADLTLKRRYFRG
jgi:hypothetical protein